MNNFHDEDSVASAASKFTSRIYLLIQLNCDFSTFLSQDVYATGQAYFMV